jgi:hypothetical protein
VRGGKRTVGGPEKKGEKRCGEMEWGGQGCVKGRGKLLRERLTERDLTFHLLITVEYPFPLRRWYMQLSTAHSTEVVLG